MNKIHGFTMSALATWLLAGLVLISANDLPYITTTTPITLLSANDAEGSEASKGLGGPLQGDSITVIHLGPNDPPKTKTVYGTVPNTGVGVPRMAISGDGRYGFVTNHSWREESPTDDTTDTSTLPPDRQNLLSVIDLASPGWRSSSSVGRRPPCATASLTIEPPTRPQSKLGSLR